MLRHGGRGDSEPIADCFQLFTGILGKVHPNVAKVEDAAALRRPKGEAVVLYRKPLTTTEMWYPRLSHRVNNIAGFRCFQDVT